TFKPFARYLALTAFVTLCATTTVFANSSSGNRRTTLDFTTRATMFDSMTVESPVAFDNVLYVANAEELYAAVNNTANAGVAIILTPGTYILSVNEPSGSPRPNGGRLELQPDMSLYGLSGDRSAVVIDTSLLPNSSLNVAFGRTG